MAAGDLTSLEAVKEWLSIDVDNTDHDDLLNRIIAATSAFVVNYLNNPVISASYEETYDTYGRDFLLLRHYPVTSVTGLWASGQAIAAATGDGKTTAWSNGYVLESFQGSQQRLTVYGSVFPNRHSGVVVGYVAGYAEDAIPQDIQQAVWELVGGRYRYMDRIGYTSKALGGQETVAFAPNRVDDYCRELLSPYRRVAPV